MSNDPNRDEDATQRFDPDATRPHRPGADDATQLYGPAGDETTRPRRPSTGDETTQPRRPSTGDETTQPRRPPAGDETRIEPAEETRPATPKWTARAGVPAAGDPTVRRPAPPEQEWPEEEEDPYQGRSWLMPVIIGMVALVLVAALSVGLWLIYRATENGDNGPAGVVPPSPSSAPATSEAPPTSAPPPSSEAPPTSEAPPSSPPPPAAVVIPPLRGDTLAEATVKLQVLGLNVEVQRRPDASLPAGEVLSSLPGSGERVAPGSTVVLVVAATPSPAPSVPHPSVS